MGIGKFADHLTQNIGQRIAIGDAWKKLGILIVDLLPINPVHLGFVEKVALLAPDFVENILPFLGRINFGSHAVQAEGAVADFFRLARRFRVNDSISVSGTRTAAFPFIEKF